METRTAPADSGTITAAGRLLRAGFLVAIPTETVYGIAADAGNPKAIRALRNAKGRPDTKPLPVMVSSADDIARLAVDVPDIALRLAGAFWPGPLTLVLIAGPAVPEAVHAGTNKVGLRNPSHAAALGVLTAAGRPLVLTSANRSGEPEARTAEEVLAALDGRVSLIVDAGPAGTGLPSTVLDVTSNPPRILRPGGVPASELRRFIADLD